LKVTGSYNAVWVLFMGRFFVDSVGRVILSAPP